MKAIGAIDHLQHIVCCSLLSKSFSVVKEQRGQPRGEIWGGTRIDILREMTALTLRTASTPEERFLEQRSSQASKKTLCWFDNNAHIQTQSSVRLSTPNFHAVRLDHNRIHISEDVRTIPTLFITLQGFATVLNLIIYREPVFQYHLPICVIFMQQQFYLLPEQRFMKCPFHAQSWSCLMH